MANIKICVSFVFSIVIVTLYAADMQLDPEIVPRSTWGARPAKMSNELKRPVPFVVIHHTYSPPACNTSEKCEEAMRWMQDFHQINRTWWDIGYNFAVGGDYKVYEGRGWYATGAHAPHYNNISIGICLIGDWGDTLPPANQLNITQQLIARGVREGHIAEDYRLVGHKQVREGTECPGHALYEEIKKWPHYDAAPDYTNLKSKEEGPRPKAELSNEANKPKGTPSILNSIN